MAAESVAAAVAVAVSAESVAAAVELLVAAAAESAVVTATQPPNGPAKALLRQRTMHALLCGPPVHVAFAGNSVHQIQSLTPGASTG